MATGTIDFYVFVPGTTATLVRVGGPLVTRTAANYQAADASLLIAGVGQEDSNAVPLPHTPSPLNTRWI